MKSKSVTDIFETVSVEDVEITISPNPNSGKFSVLITNLSNQSGGLYLSTLNGKQLYSSEQLLPNTIIDISSHKNGVYILTVFINGKKESWKVIKH